MLIPVRENELEENSRLSWAIKRAKEAQAELDDMRRTLAAWESKLADLHDVIQRGPTVPLAVESFVLAKLCLAETQAQVEKVGREVRRLENAAILAHNEVERGWRELGNAGDKLKRLTPTVDVITASGDRVATASVRGQLNGAQAALDYWLGAVKV